MYTLNELKKYLNDELVKTKVNGCFYSVAFLNSKDTVAKSSTVTVKFGRYDCDSKLCIFKEYKFYINKGLTIETAKGFLKNNFKQLKEFNKQINEII